MLNDYLPFIDNSKYSELQLISYCLKKSQDWVSYRDVTTSLGITNYKLKQLITNINKIGLIKIEVKISQRNFIRLSGANEENLQKMVNYTAVNSLRFKVFLNLFMNVDSCTREELQEKEGISAATYFRSKNALFQSLGKETVKTVSTSESQLRLLLTDVLYMFKYDKLFATSEVSERIHTLTKTLMTALHLNLTANQQEKFFYFCWVNYLRYQMGLPFQTTDRELFLEKSNLAELASFKKQVTEFLPSLSNLDIENFQRFCLSFLKLPLNAQPEKMLA